jgi:hypothetical protein
MSDADEPAICATLGCENTPVEQGYCAECTDISPDILDGDDADETPEKGHRVSAVSLGDDESEREDGESASSGSHTPMEGGSDDTNPGFEAEESDACARAAFTDAVEWFHARLDSDIADLGLTFVDDDGGERTVETPREWFREVRGWTDATIDAKRLGWAPPSRTGLLDHLMREGYDRDAILGTGLFTEKLNPLWQGRFVFPYFDTDGQPVYAISRATGDKGGGAVGYDGHPKDGLSGKYAKPAHTKEYARVTEPIFGLDSVADGEPVLITEGIADAITAQQAGYPCISPVTTRFKRDDREALRAVLEDHDVPRAYVVQDAERPSSDLDEDDRLTLTQAGEGLSGALDTAAYLADHDIKARVAELPGPDLGLDKVDLDDYLREWTTDGALTPLLASAKPAREHPAYDPQDAAIDASERDRPDPLGDEDGNDSHSALFDLDIQDATGLDADYRGASPLGHHGESETYFVIIEKRDVAYDHKYKAAYTPLTYLLCDADERSPDDPNGRLSDKEVFVAWRHAKQESIISIDDPIPRRALRHIAVKHGHCERGDIENGWKLPRDAYDATLDTLGDEYDCEPGRDHIGDGWGRTSDAVDPTTLDVVLDPELAWRAARQVGPDDLDGEGNNDGLDFAATTDSEYWQCPTCSGPVDVVRAVAIQRGSVACCEQPLADDEYDAAYRRARREYGAPLPEYIDTTTATDNWALVQGAVSQLTHWHLSDIDSTVTGLADGNEDVLAELNPTWEESSSEKRVIAFQSGGFYCREHECPIDPLRVAALEQGIIDECDDALAGEDFITAYHVTREQYGAPLPEWNAGNPAHIPVLPPAEDLLGEFTTDRDRLDAAREDVEDLYRELASDSRRAHLLTALPALGKTTSVVKNADEYPALYLAPRKELMAEVAEKARIRGMSHMHLPVFSEVRPTKPAIYEAAALIREESKDLLRQFEDLAERIDEPVVENDDDADAIGIHGAVEEDDDIHLSRGSCPVANGQYGEAWMLAVHVARHLGHAPKDIHTHDEALFGEALPCHSDDGSCAYAEAWEDANDPENPKDVLIGHYGHGYVDGTRTYYSETDENSRVIERTIAIDEFPGDVYDERFGEIYLDHATWLARALRSDVEDRQTLFEEDLWSDEWVRAWLRGNATSEIEAVAVADQHLDCMARLLDALAVVDDILNASASVTDDDHGTDEGESSLVSALKRVRGLGPEWHVEEIDAACGRLRSAVDAAERVSRGTVERIEEVVLPALTTTCIALDDDTALGAVEAPERFGGDLTAVFKDAVAAFREHRDGAGGLVEATRRALDGGEDGCRELALRAHDGYAHPLAYLLLHGVIAPEQEEEDDGATTIPTESFSFDHDDGTNLKRTSLGRETVIVDRNHHGAIVHHPPAFAEADAQNPVVGLDATGRERLWSLAIGTEVDERDIHEGARERRAFLRDVLNLQVVQTTPHIKSYSGSPGRKNFDGDVALVQSVAKEYAATQLRQDTLTATTKPGVITTKKARQEIEGRIEDDVAAVDHYGNVTGSNALGELNLGIVLGCRHFGDAVVEKWAALAGETVRRSGHGADLDYGTETANTFLQHMREDQTLQAILRFGRDKEGAVVFAHTAALAESLPVVGEGAVVRAFSKATKEVTRAAQLYRGQQFTVGEVGKAVECSRRTVRRVLNEFTDLGYLEKRETKNGLANEYRTVEEPDAGEVELPALDDPFASNEGEPVGGLAGHRESATDPDDSPLGVSSTGFVWVTGVVSGGARGDRSVRATLPAPVGPDRRNLPPTAAD